MPSSTKSIASISGWWLPAEDGRLEDGRYALEAALLRVHKALYIVERDGALAVSHDGRALLQSPSDAREPPVDGSPLMAYVPALPPAGLGSRLFRERYGLRYAYVMGAMAHGITSVEMVTAAGQAGMIAFFGAAGMSPADIDNAIHRIQSALGDRPYGFNLIHSPHEPDHEAAVVDLYLRRGVRCISASAYLRLTQPLVLYRVKGIHRDSAGRIVCPNQVIAKVSRVEVARQFFAPPPAKILEALRQQGAISEEEARLASSIPMASDLTAEADSGGHTDNRQALTLLPIMMNLRDEIAAQHAYEQPIGVGLGGGIATPESAAAAFSMGAAYILTGTVNQACRESGSSDLVRRMLAEAQQADVTMAPSADMFEMGVRVQVLKRGTMFALRAQKLYDYYRQYPSWEAIPAPDRNMLERDYFKCDFETEWDQTRQFFAVRDPKQIDRAQQDPHHRLALVFRAYLGKSSKWANAGDASRQMDFQIWCGPAIGAFNQWAKGSILEKPENRECVTVALNLLLGAAVTMRANWIRLQGIALPGGVAKFAPLPRARLATLLGENA
jgi:trans-AT polyketide synthase/acyltransferase/oxidoreductase domain-containing protein